MVKLGSIICRFHPKMELNNVLIPHTHNMGGPIGSDMVKCNETIMEFGEKITIGLSNA